MGVLRSRAHHNACGTARGWLGAFLLGLGAVLALGLNAPVDEQGHVVVAEDTACSPIMTGLVVLSSYGISVMVAGTGCLVACCAGQFGCLALQAVVLDVFIVYPLNATLWVLYRVLTPLRHVMRKFLCWFVVPFVSIFHMHPSFKDSDLDKFVLAVPYAFHLIKLDILAAPDALVREKMRWLMQKVFPRITDCCHVPDVILTNTLFRVMLGFAMTPVAWWLCDEFYMVPLTTSTPAQDEAKTPQPGDDRVPKEPPSDPNSRKNKNNDNNKALDVTFVFPKCRFLFAARETYNDTEKGNRVCLRECRLLVEELTGQLLGHSWSVDPNLETGRCTFTITYEPWSPPPVPMSEGGGGGGDDDRLTAQWAEQGYYVKEPFLSKGKSQGTQGRKAADGCCGSQSQQQPVSPSPVMAMAMDLDLEW